MDSLLQNLDSFITNNRVLGIATIIGCVVGIFALLFYFYDKREKKKEREIQKKYQEEIQKSFESLQNDISKLLEIQLDKLEKNVEINGK